MTDRWIQVTASANIPPREGRAVSMGARDIAIFNLGDRFLAVDNRCPHQGGPLSDGIIAGESVVCPLHAWKISLRSGGVERPAATNACVRTYATRVESGVVWVALPAATPMPNPTRESDERHRTITDPTTDEGQAA